MSGAFTPSPARTLPYTGWIATGDPAVAPVPMVWPPKQPTDVLDFTVDFLAWLEDGGDDVLEIVTVTPPTVTPGDVTINVLNVGGSTVTCWLGNGQGGAVYPMEFSVSTALGRTASFEVTLAVLSDTPNGTLGPAPAPVVWQFTNGRLDYRTSQNIIYLPLLT
jgi:hypothetical protein